ncbi:hypothetical protein [Spiroplasma endosymbiont of Polydrusus pterygomalis]|uniref:hypothetical protein n=1 Tax=Spiroplasma endosymbiont of Polydrusus pterygomalis TaxID=3139327 RepID=UPI003CCAB74B
MADQPQQPQVTPEMLKKLQGEKEEKTKAKPALSGIGNRNLIVKFGKDFAYLTFFPYLWIKEFFSWLFAKKQAKENQVVNINKVDNPNHEVNNDAINNKTGEINLQEIEPSTLNISSEETISAATNSSNNINQPLINNRWTENMANHCAHHEPPVVTTANNNGLKP